MSNQRKSSKKYVTLADFEASEANQQNAELTTPTSSELFCPASNQQIFTGSSGPPSPGTQIVNSGIILTPVPTHHFFADFFPYYPFPELFGSATVALPPPNQRHRLDRNNPPQFGTFPFRWPSQLFIKPDTPTPISRQSPVTLPPLRTTTPPTSRRDSHQDPVPSFQPSRNDMASGFQRMSGDARRYSPQANVNRFENRPPMNHTLCRNGPQCRKFQEGTCGYNHDFGSMAPNGGGFVAKKSLNVDSPAFTPKSPSAVPAKALGISPKAAAAATFTPRGGSGTVTPAATKSHSKEPSAEFIPQNFQAAQQFSEFVPGQAFVPQAQNETIPTLQSQYSDPFLAQQALQQTIAGLDGATPQINPYAQTASSVGGQAFFQDASAFRHPLNYHLYASIGPKREKMLPYQRASSDFFIPDDLREDLQRKSEATLQTFANSTLPQTVEYFHSLVALDTNNQKGPAMFGYPTWVYKATSSKDGHTYILRRIEGFRLTTEAAIRTIQAWKRINNSNVVQVHDAFTGRWFGDSSLIIVSDYHPMAQTVADKLLSPVRYSGSSRNASQAIPENDIWGLIVQLTSAIRDIHEAGLAAQTILPSKVLVTAKNRLRVNCCGIFDIVRYEQRRPIAEMQRADLEDLGRLILNIAARSPTAHQTPEKSLQLLSRTYSERLRTCITWLLTPPPAPAAETADQNPPSDFTVTTLLQNIADKVLTAFDNSLQYEDTVTSNLMRELENGRLVRLLTKLNVILERPDSTPQTASTTASNASSAALNSPSSAWSETGERYYLKLFRDFIFHQVDHEGRPVLDLGHIITCLNKLDAGIDEKIQLVSRDEQNCFVVSYRDVKRGFDAAWTELSKASNSSGRR